MAGKTGISEKENKTAKTKTVTGKTAAQKATSPAKKTATRTSAKDKLNKGDALTCEVCGLSVVVDECGDVMAAHEVICCGQAMKPRARRTRAAAKK
jgi:hypothetical protein